MKKSNNKDVKNISFFRNACQAKWDLYHTPKSKYFHLYYTYNSSRTHIKAYNNFFVSFYLLNFIMISSKQEKDEKQHNSTHFRFFFFDTVLHKIMNDKNGYDVTYEDGVR